MKEFIYVQAYYASESDQAEGLLSFRHARVMAGSVEDAYDAGFDVFTQHIRTQQAALNDYVIEPSND